MRRTQQPLCGGARPTDKPRRCVALPGAGGAPRTSGGNSVGIKGHRGTVPGAADAKAGDAIYHAKPRQPSPVPSREAGTT